MTIASLLGCIFLQPSIAAADNDVQLWISSSVRYKPVKKWKIEATQHLRFYDNISEIQNVMPQLSVEYSPLSWLEVAAGYRYMVERTRNGDMEPAHRYHGQLGLSQDLGPAKLSYRIRYQEKHEEDEFDFSTRLRNKVSVKYDAEHGFAPRVSAELFTDPRSDAFSEPKYRLGAGTSYKITKTHRVHLIYYYQAEPALTEHIINVGYQYRIPKKKKKKQ